MKKKINNYTSTVFLITFIVFSSHSLWSQQDIFDVFRKGTVEELQKLYKANPEIINSPNDVGYSPLVLACYSGNKEMVSFLIDKADNVNGVSNYGTPLMAAVFKGYSEIVQILIKHGVDVDIADGNGTTAAHYAVMFRNYDVIEQLEKANANFELKNNNNKSALDYAKMYNDNKLNEILNQ